MRAFLPLLLTLLACTACTQPDPETATQIAALRAEIEQLKAARAVPALAAPPELGQQMLELQIRHARLWQAGQSQDWLLTQFQLAELRESFSAVVELNGEHAALQPQLLAEVLPAMTGPALKQMQEAVDANDEGKFEVAFDALSNACTACHAASDHGFLVIQRPRTPVLDNLRGQ